MTASVGSIQNFAASSAPLLRRSLLVLLLIPPTIPSGTNHLRLRHRSGGTGVLFLVRQPINDPRKD